MGRAVDDGVKSLDLQRPGKVYELERKVMFLTRSEYDRGVNTFSPEGRLFQVEYAIEAVKLGSTSIGIRTNEGVLLAAEKRSTSKLMVNDAIEKISKVDEHVGKSSQKMSIKTPPLSHFLFFFLLPCKVSAKPLISVSVM
ncbi:unnamed protein product [Cylicostephanus goldi]|uniref:Proteasome subunit alpha type n=1 Tax=Cylicostephanus goldi TaxID=71465 RepID=A0A3P6UBX5_CYLGO|nr:unnamed protein product [Cylicostephanus goldi]